MPDILNIIHLDRREDRLQNLMEQTAEQGIAYKIWPGITENKNYSKNYGKNCLAVDMISLLSSS